jgi:hypothetical protein
VEPRASGQHAKLALYLFGGKRKSGTRWVHVWVRVTPDADQGLV